MMNGILSAGLSIGYVVPIGMLSKRKSTSRGCSQAKGGIGEPERWSLAICFFEKQAVVSRDGHVQSSGPLGRW